MKHTYYQLKYMYAADVSNERRQYLSIATAARVAGADKAGWESYCKDMQ